MEATAANKMTYFGLESGDEMPGVGLGCWKIDKAVCADVIYKAIKAGVRLIDQACDYGNEAETGAGIKKAIDEGVVKREDLWITSKLWNTYHRKEHVKAACKRSLADLGVDQLDLYMIHFPISLKFVPFEERYPPEWFADPSAENKKMEEDLVPMQETWQAMEELVSEGLVKNIGLCNVGTAMIRDVLSYAKVKPAALQIELHPYNTQDKLLQFCQERGLAVTAFSSFGAPSYVGIGMATENESCLADPVVTGIAQAHGKTAAQVVLRWAIQRGTAVIPKTTNEGRMAENIALFDFALSGEQMAAISGLNKNKRFNDPGFFCKEAFNTFYPIYE